VTIHTEHPVTKSAAVALFQSALRGSGAALISSGELYKIVPLDQAATAGGDIAVNPPRGAESTRIANGAEVVQLRYVSASEMKRVLDPISPHGGIVAADDARHTLTLTGSPEDIVTLRGAISAFDIDTMRGMSFAYVPVTSSDPDALAEDLRNVFGSDKEGPMGGMIRFIGNKRLNAILAISSQPKYLERARAWIRRLDARAQDNEKQFFSYRVQNRPAKELLKVLTSMFGGGDSSRGNNVAPHLGQSSMSSDSGDPSAAAKPQVFGGGVGSLGAGQASGIGGGVGGGMGGGIGGAAGLSSGGAFGANKPSASATNGSASGAAVALGEDSRFKLAVDDAKNALVIMATPSDYKRLLNVIQALDLAPNQVFIEATIAEVSLNDELTFGVRYFFQRGKSAVGFSDVGSTPSPINTNLGANLIGAGVGSVFPGFSYALRAGSAMATINALNSVTKVNVISTPSLTVLDNREATLQVGDQVPITTFSGSTINNNGAFFNGTQYLSTGVILAITPHISESGSLMLEIEQEVSNVSPDTPANAQNPTIQQRKVKTQVLVADGESLMLGGLIQDSRSKGADQVPVLGDIPVFGNAFKEKNDKIRKTELLIMITPHVINSPNGARAITEEYRRKLFQVAAGAKARPHSIDQSMRRVLE
jgi:general secretion pathway protein D